MGVSLVNIKAKNKQTNFNYIQTNCSELLLM